MSLLYFFFHERMTSNAALHDGVVVMLVTSMCAHCWKQSLCFLSQKSQSSSWMSLQRPEKRYAEEEQEDGQVHSKLRHFECSSCLPRRLMPIWLAVVNKPDDDSCLRGIDLLLWSINQFITSFVKVTRDMMWGQASSSSFELLTRPSPL